MTSSAPITFQHDARSAQKTAKAGIITVNDIISEDMYHVMTRQTANDVVTHTTACYSLDEDTSSLIESARNETVLGSDGSAKLTTSLLQTNSGVRKMNDVVTASSQEVAISSFSTGGNNTARFDMDGLRWDKATSSLYIGGDIFRIKYNSGDVTNNNIPSLSIQAKHPTLGGYVTKMEISND